LQPRLAFQPGLGLRVLDAHQQTGVTPCRGTTFGAQRLDELPGLVVAARLQALHRQRHREQPVVGPQTSQVCGQPRRLQQQLAKNRGQGCIRAEFVAGNQF